MSNSHPPPRPISITLDLYPMNNVNTASDTCKSVLFDIADREPEIDLGVNLGVSFSKDDKIVLLIGDTGPVLLAASAIVQSGLTDPPHRRAFKKRIAERVPT